MAVFLTVQKAEIRRIVVLTQHRQIVARHCLKKHITKMRLVGCLKVKAPCSSPITIKK
jgi:hypothetical protein